MATGYSAAYNRGYSSKYANILRAGGLFDGSHISFPTQPGKVTTTNNGNIWGLKDLTSTASVLGLNKSANPTDAVAAARKQAKIPPHVQYLLDQITKTEATTIGLKKSQSVRKKKPNLLTRVLDIISRPNYAIANAVSELNKSSDKHGGKLSLGQAGQAISHGASQGFTGKKKIWFSDVLNTPDLPFSDYKTVNGKVVKKTGGGVHGAVARSALGLFLDLGSDPTSYLTFGGGSAIRGLGKGATIGGKALKPGSKIAAKEAATKAFVTSSAPIVRKAGFNPTETFARMGGLAIRSKQTPRQVAAIVNDATMVAQKLGTHAGYHAAETAKDAFRSDIASLIAKNAGLSKSEAKNSAKMALRDVVGNDLKAENMMNMLKGVKDSRTAKVLGSTTSFDEHVKLAKSTMDSTVMELTKANLEKDLKRFVSIKLAGKSVAKIPVPSHAIEPLARLAKAEVFAGPIKTWNDTFKTASGVDPALNAVRLNEIGTAGRRTNYLNQKIRTALAGTTHADRVQAMKMYATGSHVGGKTLKDGTDLTSYFAKNFEDIASRIHWGSALKDFNVADMPENMVDLHLLNRMLPGGVNVNAVLSKDFEKLSTHDKLDRILGKNKLWTAGNADHIIFNLSQALDKAAARAAALTTFRDWGVRTSTHMLSVGAEKAPGEGALRVAKTGGLLQKPLEAGGQYGYKALKTWEGDIQAAKYLDGFIFQPEIHDGLVKMLDIMDNAPTRYAMTKQYDKIMGYWKRAVTIYNPSYYARNSFSDYILSALDGVIGPRGLASHAQASKVMLAVRKVMKDDSTAMALTSTDPYAAIKQLEEQGKIVGLAGKSAFRLPKNLGGKVLTNEEVWALYNKHGLKHGFAHTEFGLDYEANSIGKNARRGAPARALQTAGEAREDYFKLAHFIDRMKRSTVKGSGPEALQAAAEEAAGFVRKFHFDYSDVTKFEQAVLNRLFPFYKWIRKSTPLLLQTFMTKPGLQAAYVKGLRAVSAASGYGHADDSTLPTADQVFPDYFQDNELIPFFQHGKNIVYGGSGINPLYQAMQLFGSSGTDFNPAHGGLDPINPNSIVSHIITQNASNIAPAIKIPFELSTKKQMFGGSPIGSPGSYFLNQLPQVNFGRKLKNSKANTGSNWWQNPEIIDFLAATGMSENTEKAQVGQLRKEVGIARTVKSSSAKKAGLPSRSNDPFMNVTPPKKKKKKL